MAGRAVIVTGGASGIGWATAQRFAKAGDRVLIADLDAETARRRVADLGPDHQACRTDMASPDDVVAMVKTCLDHFGRVDVLINNAGRIDAAGTSVIDQPTAAFRQLLAVNLDGTYLAALEAAKAMKAQGGGVIVNVASGAALRAIPLRNGYSASKAGVVAVTRNLAARLSRDKIRVNALAPGYIRTDLVDTLIRNGKVDPAKALQRIPLGRMGTPQEMAEIIAFLASPQSRTILGALVIADGGSHAYGGSEDVSVPRGKAPTAPPPGRPTLVIAGAEGVIGRAAIHHYLKEDAALVLLASDTRHLTAEFLRPDILIQQVDFMDGGTVHQAVQAAMARFGRIDGVVNAVAADEVLLQRGNTALPVLLDHHLTGLFHVAQACGRVMLNQGFGALVNVTSILGQVGLAEEDGVAASAAAVGLFTKTLACEWGSSGIRVNAAAVGLLEGAPRDLLKRMPSGEAASADDIASVLAFLLSSQASFMNGSLVPVDGGFSSYSGPDLVP